MVFVSENREQWGCKIGFILAAAGSAVGLGNIWRFPYITGKYGGAAFVLVYLAVVAVIGMPLMLAEFAMGRSAMQDAVGSFKKLGGGAWPIVGWLGFLCAFVILSYYSVISGWTLAYIIKSVTGLMQHAADGASSAAYFKDFVSNVPQVLASHFTVMALITYVIFKGVNSGIEKSCKILMPSLFIILLLLVFRSVTLPGASEGLVFYLKPDFSKLTGEGILAAIGQGFFSLSLGMGIMITYGSYVDKNENIPGAVTSVVIIGVLIAILSGLVIFPAVFAFGIEPGAGAGLTFVTLPVVFSRMPFGALFSLAFFVLFFIAAFTSAISLLEVVVAYGIDQLKMPRAKSCLVMGALIAILGIPSALSAGGHIPQIAGKDFLDFADFITNNIAMPAGGLLTAVFVGWFWADGAKAEITNGGKRAFPLYAVWLRLCRVVVPIMIAVIFVTGLKW